MKDDIRKLAEFAVSDEVLVDGIQALVFDFDKTITSNDSWELLFTMLSGENGNDLYEAFLIDLEDPNKTFLDAFQSFKRNVLQLLTSKGLATKEYIRTVKKHFQIRENFIKLVQFAKELGLFVIIITAGVDLIEEFIKDEIPEVDSVYWNTKFLYGRDGKLYEYHQNPDFNEYKIEQLKRASQELGFSLGEAIGFGDSGYDAGFIYEVQQEGGLGVAVATTNAEIRNVAKAEIDDYQEVIDFLQNYHESRRFLRGRNVS